MSYTLQPISVEQNEVLVKLVTSNVIVDSVAGSGKTSCILHVASKMPFKRILVLTYNSRLKKETEERCRGLGLKNIHIHTYHSFCFRYYDRDSKTDKGLHQTIENNTSPLHTFDYDLFIIDEVQDMTPIFFEIFTKIYTDNLTPKLKIAVFGDKNQCIFRYKLAEQRFIELTERIFRKFNDLPWSTVHLTTSYRVTKEMALFVNKTMLGTNRLCAVRSGDKPIYLICNTLNPYNVFEHIGWCFEKYKASDIFILGASTKQNNSPICKFENLLVHKGYRVHVSRDEQDKITDEELANKICFSTIHKTKGLERKLVIMFGFDESYFKFYKRNENPKVCCNEMYVACTRAQELLIVIHHNGNNHLPFLDQSSITTVCDVPKEWKEPKKKIETETTRPDKKNYTVTGLISHMPYHVLRSCMNDITSKPMQPPKSPYYINPQKDHESVSDLTSVAITFMFEHKITKKAPSVLTQLLLDKFEEKLGAKHPYVYKSYNLNMIEEYSTPEMLYIANAWDSYCTTLIGRFYQIKDYTWLTRSTMNNCIKRLESLGIDKDSCEFEHTVFSDELNINGRIDCLDRKNNCVYEFKATQELKDEHVLQLAIYMYLYENNKKKADSESTDERIHKYERQRDRSPTRYFLYNILTDEKIEIMCDIDKMEKHIQHLIYLKNNPEKSKTDEEFIEECDLTTTKYFTTQ